MSTRIVHIGDFHAAAGPRNAERYQTLDQIIDECLDLEALGLWAWPGDLFDGVSSPEDRNAIDLRLKRMATVAPVVIVAGNHDKPGDLRGFSNLAGAWPILVVDEQPQILRVAMPTGDTASIWCLPYPFKAGLVGAGVSHGDLVQTAAAHLDPMFMVAAHQLAAARAQGDLTLMLFHANIAGAVLSTGQPSVGSEIELTHAQLDRLGPIYKGGNHVHKPQEIAGAWYAGSTARKDYGEKEEKRYLVVTIEADSTYIVESRPLRIPPMFHVAGTLDRDGFALAADADDETALRFATQDWAGCDVRVRYEYQASERAVLDELALRRQFASALRLKVESVAVPDRELRAASVAMAKTLPEKLAAMRPEGVLPASVVDKVSALEQRDREQVLGDVRAWLTSIESPARAMEAA